ncbi:MAG: MBL fold metallo-hydrolase [Candidatus Thermoplasmatota archaeon]|nr:MBL fold metallo-hydrolase [Candidatus Thermoplasmatota archaeon]
MNKIKFLGTAGARFVVIKQLRKSGGVWLTLDDTNVLIDPGPGSLVRCLSSKPKLNPIDLDAIIVTHKHIDHSNDVNIMIEAMTNGGRKKKGIVFAPSDALSKDSLIISHFEEKVEKVEILREKGEYALKNISFSTPIRHTHGVETYGLNIYGKNISISLISDTKYSENLESFYDGNILIINVVLMKSKEHIMHLSIDDAKRMIAKNKPKLAILTHFGMTVIKAKPWELAEKLTEELGIKVVAASDGMEIDLEHI